MTECPECSYSAAFPKSVNFHIGKKHPAVGVRFCADCKTLHPRALLRELPQRLYGYCPGCRLRLGAERPLRQGRVPRQVPGRARRTENQRLIRAYLREHPCTDCGEPDIVVLEFDHLRDKTAGIGTLVHQGVSWERVLEEIAKCEVACANCHRRRTARRAGYHSWVADEFEELAQL